MPRGKYTNHKGRNRKFTSPEELEEQRKQEELKQKWRKEHGGEDPSSSEEESADNKSGSGSSDESDSDEDHPTKAKGVSGLIEVENPNRVVKKNKKLANLNTSIGDAPEKPQLSRREREEIERQRAAAAYQKAHAEGKTEQARADLARLAIIRQQREEAAKKREAEKKAKDEGPKKR